MLMTGSAWMDAECAFARESRSRWWAGLIRRLRSQPANCGRLAIYDGEQVASRGAGVGRAVREIPLGAIDGTLEPSRASLFDGSFRPAKAARSRWLRVWLAEHRGAVLPPVSVVRVGDGYAVRDGHHRISVARARGALTIDALVEGVAHGMSAR
jgi:hypothetical protein